MNERKDGESSFGSRRPCVFVQTHRKLMFFNV
jgi:hypothetical protein